MSISRSNTIESQDDDDRAIIMPFIRDDRVVGQIRISLGNYVLPGVQFPYNGGFPAGTCAVTLAFWEGIWDMYRERSMGDVLEYALDKASFMAAVRQAEGMEFGDVRLRVALAELVKKYSRPGQAGKIMQQRLRAHPPNAPELEIIVLSNLLLHLLTLDRRAGTPNLDNFINRISDLESYISLPSTLPVRDIISHAKRELDKMYNFVMPGVSAKKSRV